MEQLQQELLNRPVETININDIIFLPNPLRSHVAEDKHIETLKESIKAIGLLNKVCVVPRYDDGEQSMKYMLVDGARRITAIKSLISEGDYPEQISVTVLPEDISDIDIKALQIAGNANIETTQDVEFITALHDVCMNKGFDYDELGNYFGIPVSRIQALFSVLNLPEEVRVLVNNKEIKLPQAMTLSKFYNKLSEDFQEMAVELAKNESVVNLTVGLNEYKVMTEKQTGNPKGEKVVEYIPTPKLMKKTQINALYEEKKNEFNSTEDVSEYQQGYYDALCFIHEMDTESISKKTEDFEKKLKDAETKRKERQDKKLKTAIKALSDSDYKVIGSDGEEVNLKPDEPSEEAPVADETSAEEVN